MASMVRLFLDHSLGPGQSVPLSREQAHYLFGVMRLTAADRLFVFNGSDGEWLAEVSEASKKSGVLRCIEQSAPQSQPPDLWLLFAPIKKARTDFIVEKATELGVARICPVQTDHTNSDRIRRDRLQSHAVEAAEQCGGTFVPTVDELRPLSQVIGDWPQDRALIFCDEGLVGQQAGWPDTSKAAILIGPEGGFSASERRQLQSIAAPVSLGPRILRADTAAVAAITLWQNRFGDWS